MKDNQPNQPSKFRTNNWVEINDDSHEKYGTGSQIKLKILMLRSNLCYYSHAYIFVKETVTFPNTGIMTAFINRNKKVTFVLHLLTV